MLRYAATVLISAFLLFQLQPLIARIILPWFGGSPSVWSSCMVFFQVLLLGGYAYAHVVSAKLSGRAQATLHTVLLLAACATLPVMPDPNWKPDGAENPTLRILVLLVATIGLPYFLLSSTGPLVQRWFSIGAPGKSPYRLYALSNIGSLAALLTFPFVFEPALTSTTMSWLWSGLFVVFALLSIVTAWSVSHAPAPAAAVTAQAAERVGGGRILAWLGLAAVPSLMLLAVTNVLCQDVAVVPFLWVAPLSVYLLTFILCFDSDRWYRRRVFAPLLGVAAPLALVMSYLVEDYTRGVWTSLGMQIGLYSTVLFLSGMVCHGELVKSKPGAHRLTLFYLCVSAGGALGGVFVALVAPVVFDSYVELWVGAAACTVAAAFAILRLPQTSRVNRHLRWALPCVMTAGLAIGATLHLRHDDLTVVHASRDFFGRLRVYERAAVSRENGRPVVRKTRTIAHGYTMHGLQFLGDREGMPTAYYAPHSGIGTAFRYLRAVVTPARQKQGERVRIGVIGLGAGTLAAYAFDCDDFRFYEIQREGIDAAERDFTYLSGARARGARVETILGDGRIQLERELETHGSRRFDLLVVDAFSSDAIPKHLLTKECAELYWKHLRPEGLLVINITNRFLDLLPVVRGMAKACGKELLPISNHGDPEKGTMNATWVVITSNREFLSDAHGGKYSAPHPSTKKPIVWTDDFSSLWHVLR